MPVYRSIRCRTEESSEPSSHYEKRGTCKGSAASSYASMRNDFSLITKHSGIHQMGKNLSLYCTVGPYARKPDPFVVFPDFRIFSFHVTLYCCRGRDQASAACLGGMCRDRVQGDSPHPPITTDGKHHILKGLSHEIDFKNVDENGQNLALTRAAAGF